MVLELFAIQTLLYDSYNINNELQQKQYQFDDENEEQLFILGKINLNYNIKEIIEYEEIQIIEEIEESIFPAIEEFEEQFIIIIPEKEESPITPPQEEEQTPIVPPHEEEEQPITPSEEDDNKTTNKGAIVGSVIAVIILFVVAGIVTYFLCRPSKGKKNNVEQSSPLVEQQPNGQTQHTQMTATETI